MRFVLDASIAVAAARPLEPGHVTALQLIARALASPGTLVVPTLFAIETAGALARRGGPTDEVLAYIDALESAAETIVDLDRDNSTAVGELAARQRLRGADAVYVWTAHRYALPLFTLDREMHRRGGRICEVLIPS